MKLTKRAVDLMEYCQVSNRRDIRWDDTLPGFGVRIYPSGKKSYVLSFRIRGRKRQIVLGRHGVITLSEARILARQYLGEVAGGGDPTKTRRFSSSGPTLRDLCAEYMKRHAKPKKSSWRDDEIRIAKYILPRWGNLHVDSIKHSDVAMLHSKIGLNHRYAANRVVRLISKIFRLGKQWEIVSAGTPNPANGVVYFRETKRDRWVTPEELPHLVAAIDREPSPYARYGLWLYLLTGLRKSELLTARWEQIDWKRKEMRLPETKSGTVHYLPLTDPALSVLNRIPRLLGNPYVLPGVIPGAHLVNIDKPWQRVRKAAGVEDVRLHDLRRTVGSWLAQAGNSLHLIGRVLNHSNPSTTAVYARFGQDHVRHALEQHAERLLAVAHDGDSSHDSNESAICSIA